MISQEKRVIQYAGNAVCLEYNDQVVEEILDSIFYNFETPTKVETTTNFWIEVTQDSDPTYQLIQDGKSIYSSNNKIDFAEMVLSKVCYQLAFDSKDGVLFHAAGLGYNGHGIMIPGGIGFGKSTFTAWMIAQGLDYLSDEFVYLPWNTEVMHSFYRPLHLKKPSRNALSQMINYKTSEDLILVGNHSDLVDPRLLKGDNRYYQPSVKLILFPRYQADTQFEWRELSHAETGLELMQFLINARNLQEYGFGEITRLVRTTKAIKFNYQSFDQISDSIRTELEEFK